MIRLQALCAILLAFTEIAVFAPEPKYQIAGIVVDSRTRLPIPHAFVSLTTTQAQAAKLEELTGQDGRFSFAVPQAGNYRLQVSKAGYPLQWYLEAGFAPLSSAIAVREGQDTSHLVFQARHGGAILGRVQDEDSEPVRDAAVVVLQSWIVDGERRMVLRGKARVNQAGEFRFANLRPGDYYVWALGRLWFAETVIAEEQSQSINNAVRQGMISDSGRGQPGSAANFSPEPSLHGAALAPAFYSDAPVFSQASAVHVDPSNESQVAITLRPATAARVRVRLGAPGGTNNNSVKLVKEIAGEDVLFEQGFPVSKEGLFEFRNVPPGTYTVVASAGGAGTGAWNIRRHVAVGPSDLEITLKPRPEASLFGHVILGSKIRPPAGLVLSFHDQHGHVLQARVDPQGNFFAPGLGAERYEVTSNMAGYIPMYALGPSGNRVPLPLAITSGSAVRRDMVLVEADAGIEGIVAKSESPCAGSFVLLMPRESSRSLIRIDETNTDGSFQIAGIPAGDYFLIALSNGEGVAYRSGETAAILQKAAASIHVDASHVLKVRLEMVDTSGLPLPPPETAGVAAATGSDR